MIAGALIALSCLCCHKVKSVNQLIETNIKYQALAEQTLIVGTSSSITIARTRSSGTVRIDEATSREPGVVEITANHGHLLEVAAKTPGASKVLIDASSPESANRRFVVNLEVLEATGIELSYCGAYPSSTGVVYLHGFPAKVHYTYMDDLGPIRDGRASGIWPTPPSVRPAEAAKPSALAPGRNEFLLDIPSSQQTPFEVIAPSMAEGEQTSTIEIAPVSSASVDALRLGLSTKQVIDKVQPLEIAFLANEKLVCSVIPFSIKVETPQHCELLARDGTAAKQLEVRDSQMPWVRFLDAGICDLSVSATIPAVDEEGGKARVLSDRVEIMGYIPSDDLPR